MAHRNVFALPLVDDLGKAMRPADKPEQPLLRELLRAQHRLTAVSTFAERHQTETLPEQARYYRDLIPADRPGAGEQYAFEVDLDKCTGCKSCVSACHSLNGLSPNETWRSVGTLHGGDEAEPLIQTVTTACHHCLDPACLRGCPVKAYDKDPTTGIVKHLDDQCIGCQYCVFMCPYDIPQFLPEKGVVRKCDMCSERLSNGEAPACVQACPTEAIRIEVVNVETVREENETQAFLPAAPDPSLTLPTTRYKRQQPFPRNTLPADYYAPRAEPAHPPLVAMLVLSQLAVGAFVTMQVLRTALPGRGILGLPLNHYVATIIFLALFALGASLLHLGRPLYAFRAVIGLAHSWLSREILMFGLFSAATLTYAAVSWRGEPSSGWAWAATLCGLGALHASVMVYVATRRDAWRGWITGPKFYLSAALLGSATIATIPLAIQGFGATYVARPALDHRHGLTPFLFLMVVVASSAKLSLEAWLLSRHRERQFTPLKRAARIMLRDARAHTSARFACGTLGGILLPAFYLLVYRQPGFSAPFLAATAIVGLLLLLIGEFLERHLFFISSVAARMPGELS